MKSVFLNSDYIVIEYIDLLKSPYFMLLSVLKSNEKFRGLLNLSGIEHLDNAGLWEWYVNRKHQNFFADLVIQDKVDMEYLNQLLEDQISLSKEFYKRAAPLNLVSSLISMTQKEIAGGVIIYYPHNNSFAKDDLARITGYDYTFMSDFNEVMEKAKENSTYFLSDIKKIWQMKEHGCLKFSSITLPIEYRYNKKNMTDFDIDFNELTKTDPFKLSYFMACTKITKEDLERELRET